MAYFHESGTDKRGVSRAPLCSVLLSESFYHSSYRANADVFECFLVNVDQARVVCDSNHKLPAALLRKFCVLNPGLLHAVTAFPARRRQTCALINAEFRELRDSSVRYSADSRDREFGFRLDKFRPLFRTTTDERKTRYVKFLCHLF
jgi:hypothetical protein